MHTDEINVVFDAMARAEEEGIPIDPKMAEVDVGKPSALFALAAYLLYQLQGSGAVRDQLLTSIAGALHVAIEGEAEASALDAGPLELTEPERERAPN